MGRERIFNFGAHTGGEKSSLRPIRCVPLVFAVWQIASIGLIKDGKIGAGQIRAAKIQHVIGYTEGV